MLQTLELSYQVRFSLLKHAPRKLSTLVAVVVSNSVLCVLNLSDMESEKSEKRPRSEIKDQTPSKRLREMNDNLSTSMSVAESESVN